MGTGQGRGEVGVETKEQARESMQRMASEILFKPFACSGHRNCVFPSEMYSIPLGICVQACVHAYFWSPLGGIFMFLCACCVYLSLLCCD